MTLQRPLSYRLTTNIIITATLGCAVLGHMTRKCCDYVVHWREVCAWLQRCNSYNKVFTKRTFIPFLLGRVTTPPYSGHLRGLGNWNLQTPSTPSPSLSPSTVGAASVTLSSECTEVKSSSHQPKQHYSIS